MLFLGLGPLSWIHPVAWSIGVAVLFAFPYYELSKLILQRLNADRDPPWELTLFSSEAVGLTFLFLVFVGVVTAAVESTTG